MNKIFQYTGFAVVALLLFVGAFVGFATISGAPLHTLPILGLFMESPPDEPVADAGGATDRAPQNRRSPEEEVQVGADVLGAFVMPAPYTAEQLGELEETLEAKLREAQLEVDRLHLRHLELDEREAALQDRWGELQELRGTLERFEEDLDQRAAELQRDEAARSQKETAALRDVAQIFEDGDPGDLVEKLQAYGAEDAAKILSQMDVARAAELLRAMDAETSVRFSKAYSDEQVRRR